VNIVVNLVHFLLTENIKRDNQEIIVSFYHLIQNINVDGLMRFFAFIPILSLIHINFIFFKTRH